MYTEISKELFDLLSKDINICNIIETEKYRDISYYNSELVSFVFTRHHFISGDNYYIRDINA